ncbi:hypothetical protein [Rhodococcus opacus]|uniref:hypothetical protein n=1 Tax=Rhodococcus opacus TaxID=37919 RepID=UPI0013008321|nr:hypothetical protein [Rhodococcus opacus]
MLSEPGLHRHRDFVGVGICAGDQRTVPAPAAADHQGVAVGLTVGAVPCLAEESAVVQM